MIQKYTNVRTNRIYKDTVFRDLFGSEERKENALSLYNALTGNSYTDASQLEITTLSDVIYLNMKNDVSIIVEDEMMLWEHQSTHNPNMPLRGLLYFARLYESWVERNRLDKYSSRKLELPTPYFCVFYNGLAERPERETLKLSSSFSASQSHSDLHPALEAVATVININAHHNSKLMEACETLQGYARFVELVRVYHSEQNLVVSDAIDAAVQTCIEEDVLTEYLSERRAEVRDMYLTEYNEMDRLLSEERDRRLAEEEGRKEGRERGLKEGRQEGLKEGRQEGLKEGRQEGFSQSAQLFDLLSAAGRLDEYREALGNPELAKSLIEELSQSVG